MKRILYILLIICLFSVKVTAAKYITITSQYQPMTYEQHLVQLLYEREQAKIRKENYEKYKNIAYNYWNSGDYYNFIRYSNIALSYGWYSNQMYYDRGVAYERLHQYSMAKREYRKAIRTGYYSARYALEQCKQNHKYRKQQRKK